MVSSALVTEAVRLFDDDVQRYFAECTAVDTSAASPEGEVLDFILCQSIPLLFI